MSFGEGEDLLAAEDTIAAQRATLMSIWMALNFPPDESAADTFERIAHIMESAGWTGLDRRLVDSIAQEMDDDPEIESIASRWPRMWRNQLNLHTPVGWCRLSCNHSDDETCDCPCHEEINT